MIHTIVLRRSALKHNNNNLYSSLFRRSTSTTPQVAIPGSGGGGIYQMVINSQSGAISQQQQQQQYPSSNCRRFSFSILNNLDEEQQQKRRKHEQQQEQDELAIYLNSHYHNNNNNNTNNNNNNEYLISFFNNDNGITMTRETLGDHAQMIQELILQADFSSAKAILEQMQYFVNNRWSCCVESGDEERDLQSWKMYAARQLAGVCHEMREEEEALKQCNKVFAMEKDCKRLNMLDDVFCDLNFVCAVKAEILASRGELNQALKWQNYLVEKRLRRKLAQPTTDFNFRRLLKKTLDLELSTRGKIYLALGRLEEALKDFTESLQSASPNDIDPSIVLMKARIYFMQSEYSLALIDARECLAMSTSNQYMQNQAKILIDQCLKAQRMSGSEVNSMH